MSDLVHGSSVERIDDEQYQLVLPCDVKDFGQFVSSLLGKPQEEKGKIAGCFHIEPKDVSNIYHLINQRINQQNEGSLINFSIAVLYDNGSAIVHNDVEQFESYYPTSKTIPTEVLITLEYLLKFKNKNTPEKQSIEIVISLDDDRLHNSDAWRAGGVFTYAIKHTDRTWAADIANVLENHASNFIVEFSGFMKWVKRYEDELYGALSWLVLFSFFSFWFVSSKNLFFSDVSSQFNQHAFNEHWLNFGYILFSLFAFQTIIQKFIEYRGFIRKSSFITLVDKDYEHMNIERKKDRFKIFVYFGTLITNVAAGVIASLVYTNTLA